MKVQVEVWESSHQMRDFVEEFPEDLPVPGERGCIAFYVMDHNDPQQRKALGWQCREAFEAGQCMVTYAQEQE